MIKVFIHEEALPGVKYIEIDERGLLRNSPQLKAETDKYIRDGGTFYCVASDIPLNRIGAMISKRVIKPEDVVVYLGNKRVFYSNDGVLYNWPIGYFHRDGDEKYFKAFFE